MIAATPPHRMALLLATTLLLTTGAVPSHAMPPDSAALARSGHTATLLRDGRLLVAGGNGATTRLQTVGAPQPADGPPMSVARQSHTATLLIDGRIFVVGGYDDGFTALGSTEFFEPNTEQWQDGPPLAERARHTATLLSDGRVLVAGGETNSAETDATAALSSAAIFDPATDEWQVVGDMLQPRAGHTSTLLADGRVLVAGGAGNAPATASAEIFDPATGSWSPTGFDLQSTRTGHTATLRPDGRIAVIGGRDASGHPLNSTEWFDPASGSTAGPALAAGRAGHTATLLPDGRLLVTGGAGAGSTPLATSEMLAADGATWMAGPALGAPRSGHTATLLPGGTVLLVGGAAAENEQESIDLFAGTWGTPPPAMTFARTAHTATLLRDGSVLVAGGAQSFGTLQAAERLLSTGVWQITGNLSQARYEHTATLLADGSVLVTGGQAGTTTLDSVERYQPDAGAWSTTGSLSAARRLHTATLLADGTVLAVGGESGVAAAAAGRDAAAATAERYNPATGTWSAVAPPAQARSAHTATLLRSGSLLVVGGSALGLTLTNAAEIYDPVLNQWQPTGAMHALRTYHAATLLADGRVLVTGGLDPADVNFVVHASAEIYDPAQNLWTPATALAGPRLNHTAVVLPAGDVLVLGGETGMGEATTNERYRPTLDQWETLAGMPNGGRTRQSVTWGLDGELLVCGGQQGVDALASCERLDVQTGLVGRPVLAAASFDSQQRVVAVGDNWRPPATASSDTTNSSATNGPLLLLRHLDSGQLFWAGQDVSTSVAPDGMTSATTSAEPALLSGPVLATIFVNGAPSNTRFVNPAPPEPAAQQLYLPAIVRLP